MGGGNRKVTGDGSDPISVCCRARHRSGSGRTCRVGFGNGLKPESWLLVFWACPAAYPRTEDKRWIQLSNLKAGASFPGQTETRTELSE
eukprot:782149-Rhodomonas_salina.6